jgi:uncharacterized protein (TIGR03435 family)
MKTSAAAAIVGVSVVGLLAQKPQRPLTFDVTSVKPNASGEVGGSSSARPGRYVGVNVTLRRVMALAYRPVQEFAGGPEWIHTERFDIEGRAEGTPSQPQMLEMLRSLLADRFKLLVHREVRPMPAFALVLAHADGRTGPQLRSTDPCVAPPPGPDARLSTGSRCGGFSVGNGSLKGTGVTMTQLAAELPSATEGRQVIDRTGLTGSFDVTLTWNAETLHPGAAPVQDAASIFAAIQEQLGLRLVSITTPIEVIVIDRADRPVSN